MLLLLKQLHGYQTLPLQFNLFCRVCPCVFHSYTWFLIMMQHIRRTLCQYNHLGALPQIHQHCHAVCNIHRYCIALGLYKIHRWSAALPSILGSRLLLNMRERAYRTESFTDATELDDYHISTWNAGSRRTRE